jgi:hypothetical protein
MRESTYKASMYEYTHRLGLWGYTISKQGFGVYKVVAWLKPTDKNVAKVTRSARRLGYWNAVDKADMMLLDLTGKYI